MPYVLPPVANDNRPPATDPINPLMHVSAKSGLTPDQVEEALDYLGVLEVIRPPQSSQE